MNLSTSDFIFIILEISDFEKIGSYFEKIGDGMMCVNGLSVYTYSSGSSYCNGWPSISIDECKVKCTRNEIPNTQCPRQGVNCVYALHNYWGCHLADATCKPIRGGDIKYTVLKKQGKSIRYLSVFVFPSFFLIFEP